MNRCTPGLLAALIALGASASLTSLPVNAQTTGEQTDVIKTNVRSFPKTAARGELIVFMAPEISIDGKPDRFSPGVRIRDINNSLVLSGTLSGQRLVVNYTRDNTGLVQQVWVLNADEVRQKIAGQDRGLLSNIRSLFDTPATSDNGQTPYSQLPGYKP